MLILGIDTSGADGSIALVRFDGGESQTVEIAPIEGGTFSAQLIPQVARILQQNTLNKSDIGGFAVASGPGSFTGLRVGLAAVKALAETLQKPIAAVSLLEAIAFQHMHSGEMPVSGKILLALDARRNEVFVGEYDLHGAMPVQISETLCTREECLALAQGTHVLSPDANVVDFISQGGPTVRQVRRPDAATIARVGHEKISSGQTVSALDLDANYIRRSDAEIKASTVVK